MDIWLLIIAPYFWGQLFLICRDELALQDELPLSRAGIQDGIMFTLDLMNHIEMWSVLKFAVISSEYKNRVDFLVKDGEIKEKEKCPAAFYCKRISFRRPLEAFVSPPCFSAWIPSPAWCNEVFLYVVLETVEFCKRREAAVVSVKSFQCYWLVSSSI